MLNPARLDWSKRRRDGTHLFRRPLLAAACVIGFTAVGLVVLSAAELSRQEREASRWVEHTLRVLEQAATLNADLATAMGGGRGFLVDQGADSAAFLEAASRQVTDDLADLRSLTADNPVQQAAMDRLDRLVPERISFLRGIIGQVRADDKDGANGPMRTARDRALADQIRATLERMRKEERRLLGLREATKRRAQALIMASLVAWSVLASASSLLVAALLTSRRRGRSRLAELQESEARFRALFEQSPLLIHIFDPAGQTIAVNPALERALGVPAKALRTYNVLHGLQTRQKGTRALLERTFAGDVTHMPPAPWHAASVIGQSEAPWVEVTGYPVKDADGHTREVVLLSQDVTERVAAHERTREGDAALRALNEQFKSLAEEFQTLADNIPTLCWMAHADGHIHWYNQRWYEYTGSSAEDQEGWGWESVHDADVLPSVVARWRRSLTTGEPFEMTFPLRGADGVFRPFLTRVMPIRDTEGRITRWFGTNTDITEQHEAERTVARHRDELERLVAERTSELYASEARYRMLADHTSDAITVLDLNLRRTYASPGCRSLFGHEPESMLGNEPAATAHPDDRDKLYSQLRRLASGEAEHERVINRIQHKQGHLVWVEAGFSLVRDAEGRPASIICTMRDITERQAQADALRMGNTELERLARHLARARDTAERASRAKSRFLAGISHELRTPLNGILGYAELLRLDGGLSTAQAARVSAMLGAGQHLLEMINGVLDLSEIEEGHVNLRPSAIDLRGVAKACLDLVRPAADAKKLALTVEMAPGTPASITADPTRLRQVLLNLLGNAIKFTVQGAVGLRFATIEDRLRIEVVDTGPGIPAERHNQLFQDFERLGAEAGSAEGAGLGLALSARLATLLEGRLGHQDKPGGGSVFWLELPLMAAGKDPALTAAPVADGLGVPAVPAAAAIRPLRVLVVDDLAMNRDIAKSFLHADGHEVACAEGGAEAVEIAAAFDFDVILMDVRMPEVDGLEATRRIRALVGPRGQVAVVALTAQAFAEQISECRKAGMNSHLAKPFTPDALRAAIAYAAETEPPFGDAGALRRDLNQPVATGAGGTAAPTSSTGAVPPPMLDQATFESVAAYLAPASLASHLKTIVGRGEALLSALLAPSALASTGGELAAAAHTLAGSAGMFGFEQLSTTARRFEYAVQTGASDAQTLADGLATAIEASLLEMPPCAGWHGRPTEVTGKIPTAR